MPSYIYIYDIWDYYIWLVALTILKNISQWEGLSRILWKNDWNHQPDMDYSMNDEALTGRCTLELLLLSPFVITYNLLAGKELTRQPV